MSAVCNITSEMACAQARGWPKLPRMLFGEGNPNGQEIGYWPNDQYLDELTGILYTFNGTPGTKIGWAAVGGAINVESFKTASNSDTEAIQLALDAASIDGSTVYFPPKEFSALSIQWPSNVNAIGYGATLVKNGGGIGTHIIDFQGTLGSAVAMTLDASEGAASVSVSDGSTFSAGEYILVRDDTYAYGTTGRNQEIQKILSVSGNTVNLEFRLNRSYALVSSAEIVHLSPVCNISISGLKLVNPQGGDGGCIYGDLSTSIDMIDCAAQGPNDDAGFRFLRSSLIRLIRCSSFDGQNQSSGGYAYGVEFGESTHDSSIRDGLFYNIREVTFTDGCDKCEFVSNKVIGTYDTGFNTHGGGITRCLIAYNKINGSRGHGIAVGFGSHNAGDVSIWVLENIINDAGANGISVAAPVGKENSEITVSGNKVINPCIVTNNQYGILILNSNDCLVSGNQIDCLSNGFVAYGILIAGGQRIEAVGNGIYNIFNSWGVGLSSSCDEVLLWRNKFNNIDSYNIRDVDSTATNVNIWSNFADDNAVQLGAAWSVGPNRFGTGDFKFGRLSVGTEDASYTSRLINLRVSQNATTGARIANKASLGNTSASAQIDIESSDSSGRIAAYPSDYIGGFSSAEIRDKIVVQALSDSVAVAIAAPSVGQTVQIYAGGIVKTAQFDADASAGFTRMLIYDVDSGLLQRVKAGANGTGPGGVGRALYIDNI